MRQKTEVKPKVLWGLFIAAGVLSSLFANVLADSEVIEDKNMQDFATRYAAAWSGGDPAEFAAFYAENATFRINDGETAVGRAAIEETARSFLTSFPDMRVQLVKLRQQDGTVEFHWRWTGTNTGPGGTGNAVDLRGYEAWTFDDDGLIMRMQGHMDDAEYQRQLSGEPR